ncbi:hypothetical protein R1sor_010062 [Riccia sorocarpa]|uniref:Ubiquitin-like protease family profile domain-containing protein n=1 Tax=Riccia sorocarpa TaxID=122646 RepID=A0ABD3HYC8_9MARC
MNTISKERRHAARRELYRLRARMDGRLVEPTNPDADEKSQKNMKRLASTQDRAPKRPRSEPKPKVNGKDGNIPSAPSVPARVSQHVPIPPSVAADTHAGGISRQGKEKVAGSPTWSSVDTLAEEERRTKLAVKASRQDLHVDPTLPNQMSAADFTAQVKQDCSNLPCEGQMTQSMSNMASTLTMAMEEHIRVWKFWALVLEDQLAKAKKEEEVLKAKISDLEEEKRLMNERVAMMEKKDLYELLEAKMQGYQIANHPSTTTLPDSTYEFFCTIFVPEGIESIDPNTGEKEVMEAQVDPDELESGRGRHVLRNDVDILTNNESRASALLEVNKALKLWRADNLLPGVSFVRGHRTSVTYEIDCNGIEELYSNINKSFKTAAESLPNSRAYDEYMRNVFDSYVNPNNDPDIRPLVAGLDADDFNMEKLLGTKVPKTPDDVGLDFEESLSEHARLKLKSDLLAIIVPVDTFVDLAQYISSPENKGSKDQGWPSKCDLTKEDLQSGMLLGKHLRGDVINVYIKERFIDRGRDNMQNMFFVNTFWFPKASDLVNKYDRTSHNKETMISIARLRKSISPKLHDKDSHGHVPAWIFVPIHGSNHWSLAIIRLHREYCHIVHLDSCVEIHTPNAIFHVLKIFISLTMKVDVTKIEHRSWPVDQQKDNFSCGIHVLQMLVGAGMRDADLDHCFWQERLNSIATTDQVSSFWMMLGLYLEGKLKALPPL